MPQEAPCRRESPPRTAVNRRPQPIMRRLGRQVHCQCSQPHPDNLHTNMRKLNLNLNFKLKLDSERYAPGVPQARKRVVGTVSRRGTKPQGWATLRTQPTRSVLARGAAAIGPPGLRAQPGRQCTTGTASQSFNFLHTRFVCTLYLSANTAGSSDGNRTQSTWDN